MRVAFRACAVLVLLTSLAHAQPCLDITTSHTDVRALDTLRSDVETAA